MRKSSLLVLLLSVLSLQARAQALRVVPSAAPIGARILVLQSRSGTVAPIVTFAGTGGARLSARVVTHDNSAVEVIVPVGAVTGEIRVVADLAQASIPFTVTDPESWANVSTLIASSKAFDVLKQLSGVAVSRSTGIVYVSDTSHHSVKFIAASGQLLLNVGTGKPGLADGGATQASFKDPTGIALDENAGVAYVADTANHVIRRVSADGTVRVIAGSGTAADRDGVGPSAAFNRPTGLAFDEESGTLYVADSGNHKIRAVFVATSSVVTVAGSGSAGYVDGAASQAAFQAPEGVAVRGGTLYVADTLNHRIRIIRDGVVSTLAGSGQAGRVNGAALQSSFHQPTGIAVLDDETLVVADRLNHQLRSISANGMVGTLAGTGYPGYVDAANPGQAQFAAPEAVAACGLLVVGDTQNAAVRLVYPALNATAAYPRTGPVSGGNRIRVFGTGFVPTQTHVTFGELPAVAVEYVSSTELLITVPAGVVPNTIDLTVRTPAGTVILHDAYSYLAPPSITSVQPTKGTSSGGERVTVIGTGLADAEARVEFGQHTATDVTVVSPNSIVSTTPTHEAGAVDVQVITKGGSATAVGAFTYFAAPVIQSFAPTAARIGSTVAISGANFDPEREGNSVRFGDVPAVVLSASPSAITAAVPENAVSGPLSVATAGGTANSASNFHVLAYTQLHLAPVLVTLNEGETVAPAATATLSDGSTETLISGVDWGTSNPTVASVDANGLVRSVAPGTATITATFQTLSASCSVTVRTSEALAPDPTTIATPIDPTVATSFSESVRFLYTSATPVQRDVTTGAITEERVAVIRGTVTDRGLQPLAGIRVSVAGSPQLGWTVTRNDGVYDIAVNGGGVVTLIFSRSGYLPVLRQVTPRWNAYVVADPVVLVTLDPAMTTINAGAAAMQIARATTVSDSDGQRTATMLFPAGTTASLLLSDGTSVPLATFNVRATEYSGGPQGPSAMPAALPPQSGYTYCAELSVDEALAIGADRVQFSQQVVFYVENFLEFPVGTTVPVGYYDRRRSAWIPSDSGKVIKVVGVTNGAADLDLDGNGIADPTSALEQNGITAEERTNVAALYTPGQTLWRATIDHFTPIDLNWPIKAGSPSAEPPPYGTGPQGDICPDDACSVAGSIIECQSQVLGESIPITGTNLTLEYRSSRVPGRAAARHIDVVMTTSYVPDGVQEVKLSISAAGRKIERSFTPSPEITSSFTWDGRDAYGRTTQGAQAVDVKITYVYPSVYVSTDRFASYADGVTLGPGRSELHWSRERTVTLRPWDARGAGLGGWTLSDHRVLDRAGNVVYDGDGSKRSGDDVAGAITTIAGVGFCSTGCRNPNTFVPIPALQAFISPPRGVAATSNGVIYIVANTNVFKLEGGGILRIAGNSSNDWFGGGDGGPALQAGFWNPAGIAFGPDGSMYITEPERARVRRVSPEGIVTLFAGGNELGYSGDDGLAVNAKLTWPTSIAVANDGTVYVSEHTVGRIRRITTDGRISTVAGGGASAILDGASARSVALDAYTEIATSADGSLYLAGRAVWRLDSDGRLRSVAAPLCGSPGTADCMPFRVPAAVGLAAGTSGEVYVAELYDDVFSIRRIDSDGSVTVVAQGKNGNPFSSTPFQHIYFAGEGGQATAAGYAMPKAIALAPDGALLIADYGNYRVRSVTTDLGKRRGAELLIASRSHGDIAVFDANGRHLRTIDPLTGALRSSLSYDSAGRLAAIADGNGNRTQIERDAAGGTTIIAPGGQRTTLTTDANGYLASVTNPSGEITRVASTANGLLASLTRPSGVAHTFDYDALGRLGHDSDPAGGSKSLSLSRDGLNYSLTLRTGLGRETKYGHETLIGGQIRKTFLSASGNSTVIDLERSMRVARTSADGTVLTAELAPDPRLGMEFPFMSKATMRTPGGRSMTVSTTRAATGLAAGDPLAFSTMTRTMSINGKNYTTTYDASQRRVTSRTPAGRTVLMDLDAAGRVISLSTPGRGVFGLTYGSRGEVLSLNHAGRSMTFTYDDSLRVISTTDALNLSSTFSYDDAGRLVSRTRPDGRTISFGYDANGNLAAIKPPGRDAHLLSRTSVDLIEGYSAGGLTTRYTYDADRQLRQIVRPDGETLTFGYDSGGRVMTVGGDGLSIGYTYNSSGLLHRATEADAAVEYVYDGRLMTREAITGQLQGTIEYAYDNDLRLASEAVNGSSVSFGYDSDGVLTAAGGLILTRRLEDSALAATTLGGVRDEYTYNSFGEATAYTASFNGEPFLSLSYTRDNVGRIASIGNTSYEYDAAGRLIRVRNGGVPIAEYDYDENSNRIATRSAGVSIAATYDGQDRLLTYGDTSYEYTAGGDLRSRTVAGATTSFTYNGAGNLRHVSLPGGTRVDYVIDAQNRRAGKKVNDALIRGWLYAGRRIVAELDGSGSVVTRFVYGTRPTVPDYMVRGGETYRILSDHLGSPRLVVNVATGVVVERIDYDVFGAIKSDTAPGFQPFGFAGGLYDGDTQLVRFGVRDYDPHTGRFMSTDPLGFGGGDSNLYSYALQDPINLIDPSGLLFNGAVNAGEAYGQSAVSYYADVMADPSSAWYEVAGAAVGGFFSALWTPCTSDATFTTLTIAYSANGYVARPFWQYYPANNPAYNSRWLTRGPGWRPPYSLGDEAVEKLALPPWNPATGVRPVPSSWRTFVGGPGRVSPDYGQPGGGIQYLIEGWPK